MRHITISTALLIGFVGISAHAEPATSGASTQPAAYELGGVGQSSVRECGGGDAIRVTGSDNQISLYGDCGSLEVEGSGNTIHADALGSANVTGSGNQVFWRKGSAPRFSQSGSDNRLAHEDR